MNITNPTSTYVPSLLDQPAAASMDQPQPSTVVDAYAQHENTSPPQETAGQQPLVRNKRGIAFGRRLSLPTFTNVSGARLAPPIPTAPPGRGTPAAFNPTATRFQAAMGAGKPSLPADSAVPGTPVGSSNQSLVDRFKALATKSPQSSPADKPVIVKPLDPPTVSVADVTQRLMDADKLVKAGVISTSPSTGKVVKDAFITAGVNGVVSAPINVGAYAGSVAAGEAIKGQYVPAALPPAHLPGAAKPESSPTTDTAAPQTSATPRLDRVERLVLQFADVMATLSSASDEERRAMEETVPKERGARLSHLERRLSLSEPHMKQVAENRGIIFKPYAQSEAPPIKGGRLGSIEHRYHALEQAAEKIILLDGAKTKDAGSAI